jgi:antitoxin component YwqK of YwqJK toxin-antitoxin module
MCVFGQDLKPITKKGQGFIEQYFVLATDKKVKHGEYKRHDKNGKLIMLGKYENNKRFGQWKFYSNEELVQEYDFTNKTFL